MAKLSIGQKAQRVVRFLMGLGNVRVASHLRHHGFSEADRLKGYELLRHLTDDRLKELPPPPAERGLVKRLDAWENRWFPIASASLQYEHPEVHEKLFLNLHQTEGPEVAVSVGTFMTRLDELAASGDALDGNAFAYLELRGLNEVVRNDARELLARIGNIPDALPEPPVGSEELKRREEALWGWYLEWSTIARTTIEDRRLLRSLGFLTTKRRDEGDAESVDASGAEVQVDEAPATVVEAAE